MSTAQARFSYPNSGGLPGEVMFYTCPRGCGREHATLLPEGFDSAVAIPPCGGGMSQRKQHPVEVLPPPEDSRLPGPPLEHWRADFEAERRRSRGGRPT